MKVLNKICFTICIVIGVVLGLSLIWGSHDNEVTWKGLGTVAVLFMGSALTLAVSSTFGKSARSRSPNSEDS